MADPTLHEQAARAVHRALAPSWMSVANALGGSQRHYEEALHDIATAALSAVAAWLCTEGAGVLAEHRRVRDGGMGGWVCSCDARSANGYTGYAAHQADVLSGLIERGGACGWCGGPAHPPKDCAVARNHQSQIDSDAMSRATEGEPS